MEAEPDVNSDVLVNRDDPIPVINITGLAEERPSPSSSTASATTSKSKPSFPATKLKEKLESLSGHKSGSTQEKMFNMLLQQIIPQEEPDSSSVKDPRSRKYVDRPGFSIPAMSNNFRRFNARIGVAFVFQNRMIGLFTWKEPSHTLSFLAVYTFVCLDPALLAVLPLVACLFFIMVPAFLSRHPPPPALTYNDTYDPLQGPPLAPPQNIKPAPEWSKDFFRNMRDLQNSMEDFSRAHDATIAYLAPPTNFSNEALSSIIFLALSLTACVLFITANLLPWRFIFLASGWIAVLAGHPNAQSLLESTHVTKVLEAERDNATSYITSVAMSDIILSSAAERREVEIFELQKRTMHTEDAEYEPFMFSSSPYTPLSPSRIAGDRPRGSRFFEDVEAPKGWRWADKKWVLDLLSREWVEERYITGVEVEIEGERWVTDLYYDDDIIATESPASVQSPKSPKGKGKTPEKRAPPRTSWEEGRGTEKKGEWRRRRWIRLVERQPLADTAQAR